MKTSCSSSAARRQGITLLGLTILSRCEYSALSAREWHFEVVPGRSRLPHKQRYGSAGRWRSDRGRARHGRFLWNIYWIRYNLFLGKVHGVRWLRHGTEKRCIPRPHLHPHTLACRSRREPCDRRGPAHYYWVKCGKIWAPAGWEPTID